MEAGPGEIPRHLASRKALFGHMLHHGGPIHFLGLLEDLTWLSRFVCPSAETPQVNLEGLLHVGDVKLVTLPFLCTA